MKKILLALLLLLAFLSLGMWQRHYLMFSLLVDGEPPPLMEIDEQAELSGSSYWYDDYFLVEPIDSQTFAIGEPKYAQQNYSYLILGEERGILFDAGPGYRDIRPVVNSLTDLPITFIPSHFHYDHIGNTVTFQYVAVIDLPYLRARAEAGRLSLTWREHLGASEGVEIPVLEIDEWLEPNSVVDIGNRPLQIIYTPGHTADSVSLVDLNSGTVFAGDFLYPGYLYAFLPTSHLGDYVVGTDNLLASMTSQSAEDDIVIFGAHRGAKRGIPQLSIRDVRDLRNALQSIRNGTTQGSGFYPRLYTVNESLNILAEPRFLQNWDSRASQ